MTSSTKRILQAAESRMGAAACTARSPEELAKLARWGLTGERDSPQDCAAFGRMFDGIFPTTMTEEDIAEFHRIDEMLEEACR